MGQSAPPPPQRSNFYTVVCGGTWLNRKDWDDAVAGHKTANRVFTEAQDSLVVRTFRQQSEALQASQAERFSTPLTNTLARLPFIGTALATGLEAVFGFFQRLLPGNQSPEARAASALGQAQSPMTSRPDVREGVAALIMGFFMGNRRELRGSKVYEEEQKQRNDSDFSLASPDLFSTSKIGAAAGRSQGGSTDAQ